MAAADVLAAVSAFLEPFSGVMVTVLAVGVVMRFVGMLADWFDRS